MFKYLNLLKNFICIFFVLISASCVSMTNKLGQNDGVVFLKVSSNNLASKMFVSKVYIRNRDNNKQYVLDLIKYDCINCFAFSGVIPEGSYSISKFELPSITQGGTYGKSYEVRVDESFGRFDVKQHKITNLGEVYLHEETRYRTVNMAHTLVENNHKTINDLIKRDYQNYINLLDNEFLTWNYALYDEDMNKILSDIRRSAEGYSAWLELKNGDVLFATALGKINKWNPDNGNLTLDLGNTNVVAVLTQLNDGKIIAAGDEGLLKYSEDNGESWIYINHDLPSGVISGIVEYEGNIYVTLISGRNVSLYKGVIGNEKWVKIDNAEVNLIIDYPTSKNVRTYLFNNEIIISLPNSYLYYFNLKGGEFGKNKLPGIAKEFTASNGVLRCLCNTGLLSDNFISNDGKNWVKANTPKTLGMPIFKDAFHGIGLERISLSQPRLMLTKNGGSSWSELRRMDDFEGKLLGYVQSRDIFLLASDTGRLYYSHDLGMTWKKVEK